MQMTNSTFKKLIAYSYKNVDYYHDLLNKLGKTPDEIDLELLHIFPLLNKEDIQKDIAYYVSNEHQKFPKNQYIQLRRTSGSTGQYLKIFWDYKDNMRSLLPLWKLRKKLYNIEPGMKYCSFFSVNYLGNKIMMEESAEQTFDNRNLSFSKIGLTTERLLKYYNEILKFNPDWFNFQPSVAYLLAQLVIEYELPAPSNLKYIELTGELLSEPIREAIIAAFKINPTNMYGMNETNTIALECPEGKLHVLSGNVIVEVLNRQKEPVYDQEGDIYVTCLNNFAMPFIRYETGDRGVLQNKTCTCGKKGNVLEVLSGRTSDMILLPDGRTINCYVLYSAIEYTNEYMGNAIKQFQITQTGFDQFDVTIALKPAYANWTNSISKAFVENIREPALKDAEWNFKFVDNIFPNEKTGKVKSFIKRMD